MLEWSHDDDVAAGPFSPLHVRLALHRPRLLALAALLLACAPTAQIAFIAPTNQTVTSETEVREGSAPAHLVFVTNRSTVPVIVFGTRLTACENVRQACGTHQANLRIGPGQRLLVFRIEPASHDLGFSYRFGFSWHADSSDAKAMAALAGAGDDGARRTLAMMSGANGGSGAKELTREDFAALAGKVVALRAMPESLVLKPGTRMRIPDIGLVVVDSAGAVLGATHWVGWQAPVGEQLVMVPPDAILAQSTGRTELRFRLADEAQRMVGRQIADITVPIVVGYPIGPDAPIIQGIAMDADSRTPLGCTPVALEDSAQNVVARDRTQRAGTFLFAAPQAGTYRVRVETAGWAPVYGPSETAGPGETKQEQVMVTFVDRLLGDRRMAAQGLRHAYPISISTPTYGGRSRTSTSSITSGVTIGGTPTMPILGIAGSVPPAQLWAQFVVDSLGRVDTSTVQLPHEASRAAAASLRTMLTRIKFAPARDGERPICELQRIQVVFSKR